MIITRHEGLIIYVDPEKKGHMREHAYKVSLGADSIPSALAIYPSEPYSASFESCYIKLGNIELRFDKKQVAETYFDLIVDFEKNKNLDVLKENSSLAI